MHFKLRLAIERAKKLMWENAGESVKRLDELKGTDVLKELDFLFKQGKEYSNVSC